MPPVCQIGFEVNGAGNAPSKRRWGQTGFAKMRANTVLVSSLCTESLGKVKTCHGKLLYYNPTTAFGTPTCHSFIKKCPDSVGKANQQLFFLSVLPATVKILGPAQKEGGKGETIIRNTCILEVSSYPSILNDRHLD